MCGELVFALIEGNDLVVPDYTKQNHLYQAHAVTIWKPLFPSSIKRIIKFSKHFGK